MTDEAIDHDIRPGDFFGTTYDRGAHVWHFDGAKAVRVGVPNPDNRSSTTLEPKESLRQALCRVPMFEQKQFVLHRMQLPPGAYFPRMSRPSDQYPLESPGSLPKLNNVPDLLASTLNQMRSLVGMLDTIFQAIHPVQANMACYGNSIRNLLILACTECEAQWRGVLAANGITPDRPKTNDYVKLASAMRLNEYAVKLQHYPWLASASPFSEWSVEAPTQSITWYDDYNHTKHDRDSEFKRATVGAAIHSVSALWIMIAAQFGINGMRRFEDLNRYFHLEKSPLWRYSEIYTRAYDGFEEGAGPRNFPF